ncbi:MAG TPA: sigma-54 dependent transcriptional regulator [Gemmatimonadaceae bacterium]|jgi:DNA-binding NtrC family response regulator|nr:sigma-54 dependent transcriptional regulator [Gemmatimonadaceae bacterium]
MTVPQIHEILLGNSAAIRKVRALILAVAPTDVPVLISGPTGSGKELVANAIHAVSERRGRLVAFNVCAIAESMFEDALFGHVRGAFTGAMNSSPGYLREANGGTAFLDEIGGLNANGQAKLLRAIETREFRPVGAAADVRSEFRLLTAANEDVWELVAEGRFRADLAHRLSSFVIRVPSLRERLEDVPSLALAFLRESSGNAQSMISEGAARMLQEHDWPGNVRELKHVIRSAVTLGDSQRLRMETVQEALSWKGPQISLAPKRAIAERRLLEILEFCGWEIDEAARQLGVHRTTLYRRLKRAGLRQSSEERRDEDVRQSGPSAVA